jgi:hypothetical protein
LAKEPAALMQSPYDRGWVCLLQPTNLAPELSGLRIGKPVVTWYQEEVEKLRRLNGDATAGRWSDLETSFLGAVKEVPEERVTELTLAG